MTTQLIEGRHDCLMILITPSELRGCAIQAMRLVGNGLQVPVDEFVPPGWLQYPVVGKKDWVVHKTREYEWEPNLV